MCGVSSIWIQKFFKVFNMNGFPPNCTLTIE